MYELHCRHSWEVSPCPAVNSMAEGLRLRKVNNTQTEKGCTLTMFKQVCLAKHSIFLAIIFFAASISSVLCWKAPCTGSTGTVSSVLISLCLFQAGKTDLKYRKLLWSFWNDSQYKCHYLYMWWSQLRGWWWWGKHPLKNSYLVTTAVRIPTYWIQLLLKTLHVQKSKWEI